MPDHTQNEEETVYLNQSDLLLAAETMLVFCDPDTEPPQILEAIEKKKTPEGRKLQEHELRSMMGAWVEEYYDKIAAQARCSLDCFTCPIAHVTLCFLQNREVLKFTGHLKGDNPWQKLLS